MRKRRLGADQPDHERQGVRQRHRLGVAVEVLGSKTTRLVPVRIRPRNRSDARRRWRLITRGRAGLQINDHIAEPGDMVFHHACLLGLEGIVSKRLGSRYRSGRSKDWLKFKNPAAPAEAEQDWRRGGWG